METAWNLTSEDTTSNQNRPKFPTTSTCGCIKLLMNKHFRQIFIKHFHSIALCQHCVMSIRTASWCFSVFIWCIVTQTHVIMQNSFKMTHRNSTASWKIEETLFKTFKYKVHPKDWLREPRDPRCNIQLQTSFVKPKDSFMYPILECVHMSYTCLTDFVRPRELLRSAGTYFLSFTQSVIVIKSFPG